jgi:hypothetical protein
MMKQNKPDRKRWLINQLAAASLLAAMTAPGASGTWMNPAGGSWTNPANWNAGIVADGAGNAANFTALSLSADVVVTLDAPRTIGILNFGDQNAPPHRWFLQSGTGGALTFAGTSPTVAVLGAPTRSPHPFTARRG